MKSGASFVEYHERCFVGLAILKARALRKNSKELVAIQLCLFNYMDDAVTSNKIGK
jgi:hypothetical protein